MARTSFVVFFLFLWACSPGGEGPMDPGVADAPDAGRDVAEISTLSLRERMGGRIDTRVRFVVDQTLQKSLDTASLEASVRGRTLREADDFTTLTSQKDWWDDYQDSADVLYYSAEHVFSETSPYPGATFMPHVWKDVVHGVSDVSIEFRDLSDFRAAVAKRKKFATEPAGTTWTLLSANDGLAWADKEFHPAPDEMVVVVTNLPELKDVPYSYWFHEEKYADERGLATYPFNTPFEEWPKEMQQAEGLKAHDVPIWMHESFLNGEWDPDAKQWRLFPNGRWGGYDGSNVYFIDATADLALPFRTCSPKPLKPASHYALDEKAFKECLTFTERVDFDWYRLWRHAFHVPSFPFWWSEKIDVRVVVVDLRDYKDGKPEYAESDVVDWTTFEDSVRQANPFAAITFRRFAYRPPDDLRAVLLKYLVNEADYPFHARARLSKRDGTTKDLHLDWHYHFDIPGLPGLQVYLADKMNACFGGMTGNTPTQYDPFAGPYSATGKPFVMPALFFLTPNASYQGRIGGWTANTGKLICIFATQFGLSCDQVQQMMVDNFGQPVGPNLNAWSDAYGLWWEIFVVDWTYATSPVKTLRFLLDPKPFEAFLAGIPAVGDLLNQVAPALFDQIFGKFHPWASGFPVWARESLTDPDATEWTRQFTSYQFAETLQHNIGYKHQTTVIFDSPYLGMESGKDYRKHRDLNETFAMTTEEATMPFYSTEPGSRDFPIDANSYLTHRMGAGTRHMLGRIFARREIMALYEALVEADPTFMNPDPDYREALVLHDGAARFALAWKHAEAYLAAITGLQVLDRYFTKQGKPDRLFTDWNSPVTFEPGTPGMTVSAAQLEADLARLSGKK